MQQDRKGPVLLCANAKIVPRHTPQVKIVHRDTNILSLVDGGASDVFIELKQVEAMHEKFERMHDCPGVLIGDNSTVKPIGKGSFSFSLDNRSYTLDFYVMNELPFPIILGRSFIIKADMLLDIPLGKYYYRNKPQVEKPFENKEMLCALQGLSNKH